MNFIKEQIVDLHLTSLPKFAGFILKNRFEDFVKTLFQFTKSLDVPLLKFFEGMAEEDILKMSTEGNVRLLTAIENGTIGDYIEYSKSNWLRNQLPIISKEDVIVEDISLINYARKKAFRKFIRDYTSDTEEQFIIIDEIDRLILTLDSALFKTYLTIQQEKLAHSNLNLTKREQELLEAQSLGKIGSFEWDLTGKKNSTFTPEVFKIFEFEQTSNLEAFLNDVHQDDRIKLQAAIEKSMHEGMYECEYRYNRHNKLKVLYSRAKVFFEKDKPVRMVGTVTDVTERASLINKLTENEELSKQAQALTNTGNWKWTIDQDIIEWSDEMYRIYGLAPQSEKITFQRFLTFIHDDDRNRRIAEITNAIKTGKAADYIMKINSSDGKEKVLKGKGEVLLDREKKSIGMLGTCQDITNEYFLTAELKKKNEELVRKNRDLESFNFIASHDLQEPLRKIQTYSGRILNEGIDQIPESLLKYFNKISQASSRMQKMIEDFLVFYHSMSAQETSEALNLNDIVKEAAEHLKSTIDSNKAVVSVEQLHDVSGRRKQLTQMVKHLISNAIKFCPRNQTPVISIRSKNERADNGTEYVVLSISDEGIGFDQKYAGRIFELFQKLHSNDEYSGTGIGLSLCKKIVEDHQGWISVTSEPGKGSTFSVYLPAMTVTR